MRQARHHEKSSRSSYLELVLGDEGARVFLTVALHDAFLLADQLKIDNHHNNFEVEEDELERVQQRFHRESLCHLAKSLESRTRFQAHSRGPRHSSPPRNRKPS